MKRPTLFSRIIPLFIGMVALSSCSLNTDVSGPSTVVKVSGDNQSEPINTALPTPLSVIVVTQFGEPVKNVTVTWSETSGSAVGGTLSATTTLTDATGIASITYTTGPNTGLVTIQAKVSGIPALSFLVTVI
jgi:hypothetical protein